MVAVCKLCDKTFYSAQTLNRHMANIHPEDEDIETSGDESKEDSTDGEKASNDKDVSGK